MAMPTWKDVSINFTGSNTARANAQRDIAQAGAMADSIIDNNRKADELKLRNELLDMQRADHQMKVDAVADAKEKEKALQAFAAGVSKPKELSTSGSMFAQVDADPKAFDERMKSLQLTEAENVYTDSRTDQATKDRMLAAGMVNPYQLDAKLGKQAELAQMAQNPAAGQLETRTQQVERTIKEMAQKGMPITTAVYQELDKARLADEAAKTAKEKQLDEMLKDAKKDQIDAIKYGATAQDKANNNGSIKVDDDGSIRVGGNGSGNRAFNEYITVNGKRLSHYDAGLLTIDEAINKGATADSKGNVRFKKTDSIDEITPVRESAVKVYNALLDKGVDGVTAGKLVAGDIDRLAGKDNPWYKLWGRTEPEKVSVEGDIVNNLLKSAEAQKVLQAQKMSGLTQGADGNGRSIAAGVGAQLAGQAEVDIASIKAQKALLNMTPEERQFATTKNRLDALLKPADAEVDATVARPSKTGKGFSIDKHVNAQNADAVAGSVKSIVDMTGDSFGKNGLKVAMGMTSNEVMESGINHKAVTPEETKSRGKFNSLGLYQMNGDHEKAFEKAFGKPVLESSPDEQRKYVLDYLAKNPKIQTALSKAETAADAAEIITRTFEKPANIEERVAERRAVAEQVERVFNQSSNVPAEYKRSTRGSDIILPADTKGKEQNLRSAGLTTNSVPVSNAGQYLRGELPAPDAPDMANAKINPDRKYSSGLLGWIEKQLPGTAGGNIKQDIDNIVDTIKQGGAAALGGAARTGEFFSHILDPITTSISENFDRLASTSEKMAKEGLKKRGYSDEQAEKAVIMQELIAPGVPFSKISKSSKATKIDNDIMDVLNTIGKSSTTTKEAILNPAVTGRNIVPMGPARTVSGGGNVESLAARGQELAQKAVLTADEAAELSRLMEFFRTINRSIP